MKNLLIYISPTDKFSQEHEKLTKIQIDNSLELGWSPEDIILATNFDYEYKGIKSIFMKGDFNALDGNRSSKIPVINKLFEQGVINETFWFHDHDAFQLVSFDYLGLCHRAASFTIDQKSMGWNAGSFFFTPRAKEMFLKIYETMISRGTNEQDALTYLWEQNFSQDYEIIDDTFNLGIYHKGLYQKPLMVAHFHPDKPRHLKLFKNLLPERLKKIFENYGIKY